MENIFGRLTIDAFIHDSIESSVGISIFIISVIISSLLFYFKGWTSLWRNWICSVDAKKIGIMYLVTALLMLFKGLVDAGMMRAQLALSAGDNTGFLHTAHYQQIFSAHGTTMIFFVAMGVVFGMLNLIVPLQIGARDVAFPFMNSLSFWFFAVGVILLNISLVIGNFSGAGWLAYPPLSSLKYNPGVGIDYWIWSVQIAGIGSLLSGINFITTILKMRCPGMTLMKMPLFTWSALTSMILVIFAFPILTGTLILLTLDRTIGTHFFTSDGGGNPMLYVNLIWAWGHPEVYILMLPGFGIFSEVVATFSKKTVFGYVSMIWALMVICLLSFVVWLHHFFTMGAGANVNAFFGIMTMLIAVPTGVKIFNWLFTMHGGRIQFSTPILWFLGFIFIFTTGGMSGVLLSVPPADFQFHNSLFLIAHFHSMVVGGVLFAFFAGYSYWFPKIFGFFLNEKIGRYAFVCWITGFLLAFMPLYVLGLMGATRRLNHYDASTGWQPLFIVASTGLIFIVLGVILQNLQLIISIRDRKKNQDLTGDPWDGRTLEWSISSPAPLYNFAFIPVVNERDPFWKQKYDKGSVNEEHRPYQSIHLPSNNPMGAYIALGTLTMSFAIIWHIWWLAIIGFVGSIVCAIIRLCNDHTDYDMPAYEVERSEQAIAKRKNQA